MRNLLIALLGALDNAAAHLDFNCRKLVYQVYFTAAV